MKKKLKKGRTVKYSSDELRGLNSKSDWERVDRLTDEEIEKEISSDPDAAPVLTKDWFRKATLIKPPKDRVTLRLDRDILSFFKKHGKGYQTRINQVLRAFMDAHH